MAPTTEEIKKVVQEATQAGIQAELGKLFVDREHHFLDHQYIKEMKKEGHTDDHKFIRDTRKNVGKVKTGGLVTLGGSIIGGIGWALKEWIQSLKV